MLLITNASPKPSTLGTLNGLAQTLGALGRAVAPLVSGGLFTASTGFGKNGEFLAWGVFAGIAAVGFALSFGLHGKMAWKEGEEQPLMREEVVESDGEGRREREGAEQR
jgi:cyanate permease